MGGMLGRSEEDIRASLRERPLVVICGGGYGGVALAAQLDENFNVIVIDRKNYFFHNIGALRASTQPDFLGKILIPYSKLLKYGSVVQAEIEKITPEAVFVHGRDEPIPFDFCVVATGTSYSFPCKVASPMATELPPLYQDISNIIRDAQRPLIIGGGAVGLELLGEIGTLYRDKTVTLVHSRDHVLTDDFPDNFRNELETRIANTFPNAKVILGARAVLDGELGEVSRMRYFQGERTVQLSNGESVETDLIMFCGGARVNAKSYEEAFASVMNDRKQLLVNDHLQVEGFDKIFAFGDCCAKHANFGWIAIEQAKTVAKNITAVDAGQSMVAIGEMFKTAFIPLGEADGCSLTPVGVLGNTVTHYLKGRDCAVSFQWPRLKFSTIPDELLDMNASYGDDAKEDGPGEENSALMEKVTRMGALTNMSQEEMQGLIDGLPVPKPDENATYS